MGASARRSHPAPPRSATASAMRTSQVPAPRRRSGPSSPAPRAASAAGRAAASAPTAPAGVGVRRADCRVGREPVHRGLERAGEGPDRREPIGRGVSTAPAAAPCRPPAGCAARRAPRGVGTAEITWFKRGVHVRAGEREAGRPAEPGQAGQRPLIAAVIDGVLAPLGLLGRHELGRAEHRPRNGQLGGRRLQHLRQTEVDDLREHARRRGRAPGTRCPSSGRGERRPQRGSRPAPTPPD